MCKVFKIVALIIFFLPSLFMPNNVHSAGRRQIITQTAEGIDVWQSEFNVSHLKPGTYNIIVSVKDAAGNIGQSGPYNLRIDPMAGLPETRIVYPEEGMIIRHDFKIVGVAHARHGIRQVLVKLNEGEFMEVEDGGEYWEMPFAVDDLPEGQHTVYVKAVDNNGNEGKISKISFILDAVPPVFELLNREIGDLIAGNVVVRGKVTTGIGIQSLQISTDNVNFSPLRHTSRRNDPARYFQFTIPSKKLEDGAIVYYLRATNKTGLSVTRPFLFFVNNVPPIISILSPDITENSFGDTQVTGSVISGVGLSEFYYEWQGERFDIPLRPGDPFWAVNVFFSLTNNRPVPFKITAVDKSGNVSSVTQRFRDQRRSRTPTFIIDHPLPVLGTISLAHDQPIYGHILPGFFPEFLQVEGQIDWLDAQPSFRIPPTKIPEGRNNVRMWAITEDGTMSEQGIGVRINRASPPAGWEYNESMLIIDSPEKYEDEDADLELDPWFDSSFELSGSIDFFRPGQLVEYRLRWDDQWKPIRVDASGEFNTVIDISAWPDGPIPMEVRTVTNGRGDYPIYLPVNKYTQKPVINFLTPGYEFGPVKRANTVSGIVDYLVPLEEISYSVDGIHFEKMNFTAKYGRAWFNGLFDFPNIHRIDQKLTIRVVDRAGNIVEGSPEYEYDDSQNAPIIYLNSPLDGELVTADFNLSGLAYVDVGVSAVYWRIHKPAHPWDPYETTFARRGRTQYEKITTDQNFDTELNLDDVADGINILEVFAEDIYGVRGTIIRRVFYVSTAPPEITVNDPATDSWNKSNITVNGTAFDLNGISELLVSMDNGVSYQKAEFENTRDGNNTWNMVINTKAYADGQYPMLFRAVDGFGVTSFASTIINIDNTPPNIDLNYPRNGDTIGEILKIGGQINDNLEIQTISMELVNVNDPSMGMEAVFDTAFVILEEVDVSEFPDGDYILRISAADQAGNETAVIRNIVFIKARAASEVAIMNPLPGIDHTGPVIISGKITGAVVPPQVTLLLNGAEHVSIDVNTYGVFRYDLPAGAAAADQETIFSASFRTPSGDQIYSFEHPVSIKSFGPVLDIDSHMDGDIITKRPWLSGRAYYLPGGDDGDTTIRAVEVSYDNGRSFKTARGLDEWRTRLETSELVQGTLPVIVKATFNNGNVATRRILLTVDTTPPLVNTIGPVENTSHRDVITVFGSARDEFDMEYVEVSLRPGNKIGYSVPSFIQGLYLDGSFLGGVRGAMGLGLTFFNDNVKLQFSASYFEPGSRYSDWGFGVKVLANIYALNLSRWFGPNFEFWNTSIALGAHFSYLLMEPQAGERPLWMSQFLGQWEVIKTDLGLFLPKWKYFKTFSFYVEPGVWFAPTDVTDDPKAWKTLFTIGFGFRINLL